MATNEWLSRTLTNASFEPSGDQRGLVLRPQAFTNGGSALSAAGAPGDADAI
jgi:hypothetical protein